MTSPCEHYRSVMADMLSGLLPDEQSGDVRRHLDDCPACREYFELLRADDELLTAFTETMQPVVSQITASAVESLPRRSGRILSIRRLAAGRFLRLAVAAAVIGAVVLVARHLLGPVEVSNVSLAQTLESMQRRRWVHTVTETSSAEGVTVWEDWECFDVHIRARKPPNGFIEYANYAENVVYSYNPNSNKITVSFQTDNYMIAGPDSPSEQLSQIIKHAEAMDARITREPAPENGPHLERITLVFDDNPYAESTVLLRDTQSDLIVRMETTEIKGDERPVRITTFDYPEAGPKDIYALGVPADAIIFDIRPEGPALALVDQVQAQFDRGFGDHLAVVLESGLDEEGTLSPSAIALLRQQGQAKRCDRYHAFNFAGRADAPPTLYARIKDDWPDLTTQHVLEVVDANAMERSMLFDGRRTIRWLRLEGELRRDEHPTDQFKVSPEPLASSLTSLIWPNLHLRMQRGSSQLKRDVRLLPEDPNRPGLVGLRFVGFAETEDYWFDPDKDYMRMERAKKQHDDRIVSRLLVTHAAETPSGQWYPQVMLREFATTSPDGGTKTAREELRVLVDSSPSFDRRIFDPAAFIETPESVTELAAEPVPPAETRTTAVAGTVRDEQGRPIAEATVLLYHKRNRYGLGNRVVEQLQTDRHGRYVLTSSTEFARYAEHAYAQDTYILIALHPDYAFAWQNIEPGQETSGYDLTLTAPTTRVITVTDHDDHPLPNARVWLYGAGDRKSHSPLFRDSLNLPTDIGFIGGTADASGHAVVTNLPGTKCSFHATLDGYATGLAFSGQNRIRLSPGADVAGWVQTDAGEPVSGAVVRLKTGWMWNYFLAESDDAGRFVFVDLPAQGWDMGPWGQSEGASGAYTVSVGHPDYAAPETNIELLPGQVIDDLVLTVSTETAVVRCLVLEEGTDAPVAGARISGTTETGSIDGFSDANGVFTIPVLPGPVSLLFYSPPDGVYTLQEEASGDYRVEFEATPGQMEVTLRAPPMAGRLVSVSGTVHDPGGLPVSNAVVYAGAGRFETATATAYVRPAGADANGRFELKEVPAGRDLHVYAESEDRMLALAAVVHIPADPNESKPLELVLQPTATAVTMIEGKDGNPSANTDLTMSPVVQGERIWPAERRARTDQAGVLRIEGIVPGLTYRLRDARLEDSRRYPREEWEKWLDREVTLIPLDQ